MKHSLAESDGSFAEDILVIVLSEEEFFFFERIKEGVEEERCRVGGACVSIGVFE